jgi:hypothetical protein
VLPKNLVVIAVAYEIQEHAVGIVDLFSQSDG